jgi:hypothetical protein
MEESMIESAIIPKPRPSCCSDTTLRPASAEEYLRFAAEFGPVEVAGLASEDEQRLVELHGVAVSMEIFDTLRSGIPFSQGSLVGELCTLETYKPKTQLSIISAVCRWLAAEKIEPQLIKVAGRYMVPSRV